MRQRVSIIIISNKKLLLVKGSTGFYNQFYFTPGGKIENGETQQQAIIRELNEELSIIPIKVKPYLTYTSSIPNTQENQQVNCYILEKYEGVIKINSEISELFWYDKNNFKDNSPAIANSIYSQLIPKLIKDNLL